jgi:NADH:ubiquinone oxidoreductase subunit
MYSHLFFKFYIGLVCKFWGRCVGRDQYANQYFVLKSTNHLGKKKRICLYNGIPEGSKVPPLWADWLNYRSMNVPDQNYKPKYSWIMPFLPSLTLSKYRYLQLNHEKYNPDYDLVPRLNLKNKTGVRHCKFWSPNKD